ncbi:hypothetical protein D3C71_1406250 [compost metagenome]
MTAGGGTQDRQRQRVIASQRQRDAAMGQNVAIGQFDTPNAVRQTVGIDGDIPQIGNLQPFERGSAATHVVRADHHRLLTDLPRPIARAAAV